MRVHVLLLSKNVLAVAITMLSAVAAHEVAAQPGGQPFSPGTPNRSTRIIQPATFLERLDLFGLPVDASGLRHNCTVPMAGGQELWWNTDGVFQVLNVDPHLVVFSGTATITRIDADEMIVHLVLPDQPEVDLRVYNAPTVQGLWIEQVAGSAPAGTIPGIWLENPRVIPYGRLEREASAVRRKGGMDSDAQPIPIQVPIPVPPERTAPSNLTCRC